MAPDLSGYRLRDVDDEPEPDVPAPRRAGERRTR